jgi:hypothetical protein
MRTVPLTAVRGCVDERQPRGRRPLARRCRAAEAGRSGGDDFSFRAREVGTPKSGQPGNVDMSLELLDCLRKLEVQRKKETL